MNHDTITLTLQRSIALHHDVQMLFAVESGSRAWGFASNDSDYDVRFVYLQKLDNYLCVHPKRDVIEETTTCRLVQGNVSTPQPPLDFAGWDLRKFFALALKSNPTVFEWLASPIVYVPGNDFWQAVRLEVAKCFSPKASLYHYLSMAKHNYREHLRDGTAPKVRLKKYLYITRPLLCCRYVEGTGQPPPMPFVDVLNYADSGVTEEVRAALLDLVERKRTGDELSEGPAIPVLNSWIDAELLRLPLVAKEALEAPTSAGPMSAGLDMLFFQAARYRVS